MNEKGLMEQSNAAIKAALELARGMSDERPDKFAGNGKKPVRRGGS